MAPSGGVAMIGTRIHADSDPIATKWPKGAYGYYRGIPYAITPNGHVANLSRHEIVDRDSLWTVSPSIRVFLPAAHGRPERELYHGFLKHGEWTP